MGLISILRGFSAVLFLLGIAMLGPFILALIGGEESTGPYLFGMVLLFIVGAGGLAASSGDRPPADFRGALVIVMLWWTIAPLFAAIPLALNTGNFSDSYFDAIAGITTTGGWLSQDAAVQSPAGMLWRAELQWLGGFASISIAAAIFIRPAFIGIDTLLPPFSRGERGNFLRPLRNAMAAFAPVYAGLTVLAGISFAMAGNSPLHATVLAMTSMASGGFLPGNGEPESINFWSRMILFVFMILGGANFVIIARIFQRGRERVRDIETGAYLMIMAFAAFFFWLLAGAGDLVLLIPQLFNAASVLSTNGLIYGEAPPLSVVMVTAIIGGAAVSTAGGFKILRWMVIMRRAREEVRRLIEPSAVFGRRTVANEFGVWIHFLVFTMTLAVLVVILAIGAHSFELAAAAAVASLSNSGPLIYLAEQGKEGFFAIEEPYRWALAAAMVLGRLEAAVALALINRWFWRA